MGRLLGTCRSSAPIAADWGDCDEGAPVARDLGGVVPFPPLSPGSAKFRCTPVDGNAAPFRAASRAVAIPFIAASIRLLPASHSAASVLMPPRQSAPILPQSSEKKSWTVFAEACRKPTRAAMARRTSSTMTTTASLKPTQASLMKLIALAPNPADCGRSVPNRLRSVPATPTITWDIALHRAEKIPAKASTTAPTVSTTPLKRPKAPATRPQPL